MFNRDIQNEQVLARYLDLYFYPRFNLHNFQRINDVNDAQFAGIDVQFVSNNQIYIVDEKGYLSRSTIQDTFVLELSSLNRNGQRVEGWFYKPEKQTTHYLMCWEIEIR
ncbi:hypothetical protein [Lysinibacillus sphaericus]|uniref:hypothetical protein n=1 Tax=Lysinibacillus sphaericus TaxID=1421 RepID=UPI001A9F577F|nr:hypothetical protein [Lysinibacillus sphaericus]QTB26292.1 hypothetical protein J2D51_18905 [Lysinibacillus sphaericus]